MAWLTDPDPDTDSDPDSESNPATALVTLSSYPGASMTWIPAFAGMTCFQCCLRITHTREGGYPVRFSSDELSSYKTPDKKDGVAAIMPDIRGNVSKE
ncbi:hypothetical protein [Desulfonatronum parangueonense]